MPEQPLQKIYVIPKHFFDKKDFLIRYKQQLAIFRTRILKEEKEELKGSLNAFYYACCNADLDKRTKLQIHLLFFETLAFYAQMYKSVETCLNIIRTLESKELKEKLAGKFPIDTKLLFAETYMIHYELVKFEEPIFSPEKTGLLIKAKSYLWKTYLHHLDGVNKLNEIELSHCLALLSRSLTELSRWFEGLRYLNEAKLHLFRNPNIEYLRAMLLQAIKQKTCLSYNDLLNLSIIDSCTEASELPNILDAQKEQLNGVKKECKIELSKHSIDVKTLRSHRASASEKFKMYSEYKKFCSINELFLNEHSFFCNCSKSTRDDIGVRTNHPHTKIAWAEKFENLIDEFAGDFIIARHNYYHSLENVKIPSFSVNSIKRRNSTDTVKNALLKNAFKSFYSILDQIAHGILKVMEIDHEAKINSKYPDPNKRPKIYFLNMWDLDLFTAKDFTENFYLVSLYSIAQDLNRSDFAALEEFRTIRNAIEHKTLFIRNAEGRDTLKGKVDNVYSKESLLEKTRILMMLTKSAIFSFTYLIRRQSKSIEVHEIAAVSL